MRRGTAGLGPGEGAAPSHLRLPLPSPSSFHRKRGSQVLQRLGACLGWGRRFLEKRRFWEPETGERQMGEGKPRKR